MYFDAAGINPAGQPKEYPPLESAFLRLPRSGGILFPALPQGIQNNKQLCALALTISHNDRQLRRRFVGLADATGDSLI